MSQAEAAQRLNISMQRYHDAEAGRLAERDIRVLLQIAGDHSVPSLSELCALARRRTGWTLDRTQLETGMTRVTYLERECAGDSRIVDFWCDQGFVF